VSLRSVNLALVSIQTAFVAKAGVFTIWDLADVRLIVFSFVLSEVCQCWCEVSHKRSVYGPQSRFRGEIAVL
jgi:hypothetical protein